MRPLAASLILLATAAPVVAGCGERAAAPAAPHGDLLVLRAGAERTLTLGAGAARALPAGQLAPAWRSLYTATPRRRPPRRPAGPLRR
jgi:hypothetical protein